MLHLTVQLCLPSVDHSSQKQVSLMKNCLKLFMTTQRRNCNNRTQRRMVDMESEDHIWKAANYIYSTANRATPVFCQETGLTRHSN
jgi:hypothetical protein